MKIAIGITGGIGTGKSTVSRYIADHGFRVIDADALSRQVVAPGSPALAELADAFGSDILTTDGLLDRGRLAELVFADPDKRRRMESIITARIIQTVKEEIEAFRDHGEGRAIFLDAPTLFETGADALVDAVWLVTADLETRIRRCMERDHSTRSQVESRMKSQMPEEEKIRLASAVIDNSGDRDALCEQIECLLEEYVPHTEE